MRGPPRSRRMKCPRCRTEAKTVTWRALHRRLTKHLWVPSTCWECPSCRLRFLDEVQEASNWNAAQEAWRVRYDEELLPRTGERLNKLMRTEEGRRRVGRAFGELIEKSIKEKS